MHGTKWAEESFYLNQEYLSNTELYYSSDISDGYIQIHEEESKHLLKVMRHKVGDQLYITNGEGKIFNSMDYRGKNGKRLQKPVLLL